MSSRPRPWCFIHNPFTAISNGTWLHNRSKEDVFRLIVDTYRMRVQDEYVFQGNWHEASYHSGASDSTVLSHFKDYLSRMVILDSERENKIFPEWWSQHSQEECVQFAENDFFSTIHNTVIDTDITSHYDLDDMPLQMRIFAEKMEDKPVGTSLLQELAQQVAIEQNNLPAAAAAPIQP